MSGAQGATPEAAAPAPAARPSLIPLGAPAAACEGDTCVIP
ncbi:hypothetical protein [Leifsonia shinshuensis]|nr:hypothetical protein [Leifsonia shinshuensis]MDR6970478.1 hypothetical protein [Leifsonia shinshuensis]